MSEKRGSIPRILSSRWRAVIADLPKRSGEREIEVIRHRLGWDPSRLAVLVIDDARGPGNGVILEIDSERGAEVFTGWGERHVGAEAVAPR